MSKVKDAPQEDQALLCHTTQPTSSMVEHGYQFYIPMWYKYMCGSMYLTTYQHSRMQQYFILFFLYCFQCHFQAAVKPEQENQHSGGKLVDGRKMPWC